MADEEGEAVLKSLGHFSFSALPVSLETRN